ncbi:MAG: hypothetical protein SFX72_09655, partial [Isosphaeraceae bacterium]|nr:hypothetical protein [Isosphaeraceae bacterium]
FVPHDKGTKADPNALRLREMHRNDPPEPTAFVKTDPASVERRLDENLREALEQQAELKASAPSTDLFYRNLLIQAALVVVSLAALGYAAHLVIRGRRGS